jgi:flavorubredoxin
MHSTVNEVAPNIFRISTFIPEAGMQFSQFLVRDDEPLLYHTGMRALFPLVLEAVSTLIDPAKLKWISFSHFEADESGALNEWLQVAPQSQAVCSVVGKMINVDDFAGRPARPLQDNEVLTTGQYRFRFLQTPQFPHGWDAGLLFEETEKTLFCSDLFHQIGDLKPLTNASIIDQTRQTMVSYQSIADFTDYMAYTPRTAAYFERLIALAPRTLATMHGSVYSGDGQQALRELAQVWQEVLCK